MNVKITWYAIDSVLRIAFQEVLKGNSWKHIDGSGTGTHLQLRIRNGIVVNLSKVLEGRIKESKDGVLRSVKSLLEVPFWPTYRKSGELVKEE